jgi:hypothetical protein
MSEFANEITERVAQASSSLREAAQSGDDFLADVRVGELEELARVAADHDVEVPGLQETLEAHTGGIEIPIDLREEPSAQPDPA